MATGATPRPPRRQKVPAPQRAKAVSSRPGGGGRRGEGGPPAAARGCRGGGIAEEEEEEKEEGGGGGGSDGRHPAAAVAAGGAPEGVGWGATTAHCAAGGWGSVRGEWPARAGSGAASTDRAIWQPGPDVGPAEGTAPAPFRREWA